MKKLGLNSLLLASLFGLSLRLHAPSAENKTLIHVPGSRVNFYNFNLPAPLNPEKIRACVKEVKKINYHFDHANDYLQSPKETRSLGFGDCGDKAVLTYFLLEENGYKPSLCYGVLKEGRPVSHLWNEIIDKSTGKIYIIETTIRNSQWVYLKDTLNKQYYILRKDLEGVNFIKRHQTDFNKRNNIKLRIKNLEDIK